MAFISTENVKIIRNNLKKKFPKVKFSVRCENYSTVSISILKSGMFENFNNSESHVYMHDFDDRKEFTKIEQLFLTRVRVIAENNEWYDRSDSMTDYFDTAYYIKIQIGKYDKDYIYDEKGFIYEKSENDIKNEEIEEVKSNGYKRIPKNKTKKRIYKYYTDSNAIGTQSYYKSSSFSNNILHTDGVQSMIDKLQCYWLLDVISSYRNLFKTFMTAKLHLNKTGSGAKFILDDGNDNIIKTQRIPYTDCKENIKLFIQYDGTNFIIMLPSEY